MNTGPGSDSTVPAGPTEFEAFPDMISAATPMIERGDALEIYRAYDDGVLAEVPHALEAYMSHLRFDLN